MPLQSSSTGPSTAEIRRTFIDFFRAKPTAADGHSFVASSPVVPLEDPTLLFTNAGMNQFKPIFLGQADPASELGRLKRAVNSQKCIRAGGKHNDLEDVGKDTYHHTFFEMLGNWSFGDYFKKEAIAWSWELLTKVYGINAGSVYATYFKGDPKLGLDPDEETRQLWLQFLPAERVLPGNMKDNFWEMGDTGPCGPCTEIHFDRLGQETGRLAASLVNSGDPDVLEIWNNVFIQFERLEGGSLRPLPARHVDTGMGLERLVSVLQHKRSNYDTDVFMPLFREIERLTGARAYTGRLGNADEGSIDTAYRVIADHIRTLTFALTDGAMPSNVGRGYVLRRILRRAVRYGRQMLGAKSGFFAQLAPVVVETMGDFFPELKRDPQRVMDVIRDEEESFGRTLDRGIKLFGEVAAGAKDGVISGPDAFKLYDTFGFPIDLTELMAGERGLKVDMTGYDEQRKQAEELSRAGTKSAEAGTLTLDGDAAARLHRLNVHPTDDSFKFDPRPLRARVRAIWNGENFDESAKPQVTSRRQVGVVLDRTNFYAEMGGQQGDIGTLRVIGESRSAAHDRHTGGIMNIEHTAVFAGFVLHVGHIERGEIRVGDTVQADIDHARREAIAANHTSTHLVNFALRRVLGQHVDQKGSLVAPDRMRFDFSHNSPVASEQLAQVNDIVNRQIADDLTVYAQAAPLYLARSIHGLRAVFGEQYPDPVRVVSVGQPVQDLLESPNNTAWGELSVELCGGTHVPSTKAIASFAVISEEAVAKGVRRVVAVTGQAATQAHEQADLLGRRIKSAAVLPDTELVNETPRLSAEVDSATIPVHRRHELRHMLGELQERAKSAEKQASKARQDEAVRHARAIADSCINSNDNFVVTTIDCGEDRNALQAALKLVRDACPRAAVMLFSTDAATDKVTIMASVPEALVARGLKAGDWIREACTAMGGKGGGKPDNAQGGAPSSAKIKDGIGAARTFAHRVG